MSGRTDRLRIEATPQAVPAARQHIRRVLKEWLLGPVVDEAALIVSELVTNGVRYSEAEFLTVALRRRGDVLVIEVSDPAGSLLPTMRDPGPEDCGGRGLHVVDALAERWGVRPHPGGKTVFAHLALGGRRR
ncbi:ATP-binding protein [Streptomyces sp. NPDC005438]|uniref:ATP-binding protein n=1 Tax=Streptomyces sp. NPDC005438 TaxID=3156880 RepID=UPI0033BBBD08